VGGQRDGDLEEGLVSQSPRIYVDVDDVLSETVEGLLRLLRDHFGREVALEDCRDFDLGRAFGLDAAELRRFMELAHEPGVLDGLLPVAGARDVLESWTRGGYVVSVVTGRPPSTGEATRAWLHRQRLPHHSLSHVDKYGRHGDAFDTLPLEHLAGSPYVLAVEDSLDMAAYLAATTRARVLLYDRPWNRHDDALEPPVRERIVRVRSWTEIGDGFGTP
jgi:uncharacterized HAD superfamily protein